MDNLDLVELTDAIGCNRTHKKNGFGRKKKNRKKDACMDVK